MKKADFIKVFAAVFFFVSILTKTASESYTDGPVNAEYNRTDAAQYIYDYTETANSFYYDFTYIGGDCTSFVSQVVRAGGMPMTPPVSNPNIKDWYYYSPTWGRGRTATWTNAHSFRYYWANVNGFGCKKAFAFSKFTAEKVANNDNTWLSLYSYLEPGDIIQYVSSGQTYHSQAVYSTSYENQEYRVSVGQHTTNDWKELRQYISTLPADTTVYVIKIKAPPAGTNSYRMEAFSKYSMEELEKIQNKVFNTKPVTDSQENEKWKLILEIKTEMVRRAENVPYQAEITKDALNEIVEIRIENNNNIACYIACFGDKKSNYDESSEIMLQCEMENEILTMFLQKVRSADENNKSEISALWSEYWYDIVKQPPPEYYVMT